MISGGSISRIQTTFYHLLYVDNQQFFAQHEQTVGDSTVDNDI